ncbi:MAG: hypothetical protein HYR74_13145 [Candidatus Eisenbacteria bacterium]|nr:hypothetical protein [Candidatus Eisenbacteria bacterium]
MPLASRRFASPAPAARVFAALLALAALACAGVSRAAPTLGFVEHFAGTSTGNWSSGNNISNPGAGGALGAGDGYLLLSTPGQNSNLGATGTGPDYTGSYSAAGITNIHFSLNDVGNADPLEIHMGIGNTSNLWETTLGFVPPFHAWAAYSVDITSAAGFTQIIGSGTFDAAVAAANRLLIRHDKAPLQQHPSPLDGDFGLDEVAFANDVAGVGMPAIATARPIELASPYPNPSRGPVALALRTFRDEPITIQVVDVAGRVLRQVTLAAAPAGPRLWTWDGRGDDGARAAPGVYRVRAFGPSGGTSRPLVRLAP